MRLYFSTVWCFFVFCCGRAPRPHRLHARFQLSLVQHSRKDVAQVGAQFLDAPLTVAGILRVHQTFLLELLNDLANLRQAAIEEEETFV